MPTGSSRYHFKHSQRGFTLLGTLVVVAAIGLGMAKAAEIWQTSVQREREEELLFVGDQFRRAIESYRDAPLGGAGRLPRNLEDLIADQRSPSTARHLRRSYPDPMTGKPDWVLVKEPDGGIAGVHSKSDLTPFKKTGFDPMYAQFSTSSSYREWVFAVQNRAAPSR